MLSKDTGVPSSVKNRDPHGENLTHGKEIGNNTLKTRKST